MGNDQAPLFSPISREALALNLFLESLSPTPAPSQSRGPQIIILLAFQVFMNSNTATGMPQTKAIGILYFLEHSPFREPQEVSGNKQATRCV